MTRPVGGKPTYYCEELSQGLNRFQMEQYKGVEHGTPKVLKAPHQDQPLQLDVEQDLMANTSDRDLETHTATILAAIKDTKTPWNSKPMLSLKKSLFSGQIIGNCQLSSRGGIHTGPHPSNYVKTYHSTKTARVRSGLLTGKVGRRGNPLLPK
ncbi:hypothetical protein NDU88_009197 [Pleurodeles waltl]|uniref:Uncharacterized protein n=1 Tax=Pleurodeles waltl TaxID=8319 RepID=A0AAV7QUL6_PLEWA|nr:hypothetical protein NDU88_009197 [Pleurodeles waltl]